MTNHTDPICGMQVDEKNAAGQSQHDGQTYYFCSPGCKAKFDQNPQQYAQQNKSAESSGAQK